MPYYVPQEEAAATAAFARSLMGLGAPPPIAKRNPTMYARPSAASIAARAAASSMLPRRSQRAGTQLVMSGQGLGILPTVNVRYAKTAIPAALAQRRRDDELARRRRSMAGLGKMRAAQVPVVAGYRRQPGFFMGPGGGPGGGPFHFPGYAMSGMGLSFLADDPTMYDPGNTLTPPVDVSSGGGIPFLPQPSDFSVQPTTYDPTTGLTAPTFAPATAAAPFLPSVQPSLIQQLTSGVASIFGGGSSARPGAPAAPSASLNLSGVLPLVVVGGLGLAIVSGLERKRRR